MAASQFACLMYHFIGDSGGQYSVSEPQFAEHLTYLHDQGFIVEGFEQLEQRIEGREPLPERYVLLTIDDGESSSCRFAEALSRRDFQATFFVVRDYARDAKNHLNEQQVLELRTAGFSIGTHGTSHQGLSRMPLLAAERELRESRDWLGQLLGEPVHYMSAPHGYINRRILDSAFHAGYRLVGTSVEATNAMDQLDLPSPIARVAIRRRFTLDTLEKIISGYRLFYMYRRLRSAALTLPKRIFA